MKSEIVTLVEWLNSRGLTIATGKRIQQVTKELFPQGTANMDQREVLRSVLLHLKRQKSENNVR